MKVKIQKCASLGIQASTGRKVNPKLMLRNELIPFAEQAVKSLTETESYPI